MVPKLRGPVGPFLEGKGAVAAGGALAAAAIGSYALLAMLLKLLLLPLCWAKQLLLQQAAGATFEGKAQ
jgi:hypothetical protein